jgi:phosphatidylglycerol:prolipoprotein diacylglycerol transferase
MLYSFERFFVEGLRTDSLMIGPFRQAQVISVTAFIICFVLYRVWKKKYAGVGLVMKPESGKRK